MSITTTLSKWKQRVRSLFASTGYASGYRAHRSLVAGPLSLILLMCGRLLKPVTRYRTAIASLFLFVSLGIASNAEAGPGGNVDTIDVVDTLMVQAAGSYSQWASLSGGGFTDIDDNEIGNPDDDDSYMYCTNNPSEDSFVVALQYWNAQALVSVDSIVVGGEARKNGGAPGASIAVRIVLDGTSHNYDTTNMGNAYGSFTSGPVTVDPETSAAWTQDSINAMEVGIDRIVSPALGKQTRVTNLYVLVYFQQEVFWEVYDDEIADTWMREANPTFNYGSSPGLDVGYNQSDGSTRRSLIFIDTTIANEWKDDNSVIDSAFLTLRTYGSGGHLGAVLAYSLVLGAEHCQPGTADNSAQSDAVAWGYRNYDVSLPDNRETWFRDGADSSEYDRYGEDSLFLDSATCGSDSTLYTFDVTGWVGHAIYAGKTSSYGHQNVPLLLKKVADTSSADTATIFFSRDHATAVNRPTLTVYGHQRHLDTATVPEPAAGSDSMIFFGDEATAGNTGLAASVGIWSARVDTARISRSDIVGGTLGWVYANSKNQNDWAEGDIMRDLMHYANVFDSLDDRCLCDDGADTLAIDSVIFSFFSQKGRTNVLGAGPWLTARGPVLARVIPHDTPTLTFSINTDSTNYNHALAVSGDTVNWETPGVLGDIANILGDDTTDYHNVTGNDLNYDVGYVYDAGITGHVTPFDGGAGDEAIQAGVFRTEGVYQLDLTRIFRRAHAARIKTGGAILDTLGFNFMMAWTSTLGGDDFRSTYANSRAALHGFGAASSVAPQLRIFTDDALSSYCPAGSEEYEGTVIIIGAIGR